MFLLLSSSYDSLQMLMSLAYSISKPNLKQGMPFFSFLVFMGKSYSLSGYRDNHIARVSSLEVAESVLHLINCCLLNFQVLSFSSPNHHFPKKKKKKP
jgi:hypothetical protein